MFSTTSSFVREQDADDPKSFLMLEDGSFAQSEPLWHIDVRDASPSDGGLMKMQLQSSSNCDLLFSKVWASLAFSISWLFVLSFFLPLWSTCQQFGSCSRLCWTCTAPNPTQFLVGILNSAAALSVFVLLDLVIQWETVRIWYSSTWWNWGCRLGRHLVIEASWLNPLVFYFFLHSTQSWQASTLKYLGCDITHLQLCMSRALADERLSDV